MRHLARLVTPLLLISEIRTTAADRLWLSGSYDRETLAIHFTWRKLPDQVDAAVREVEAALAPFAARPHWGKVSQVQAQASWNRCTPVLATRERCSSVWTPKDGSAMPGWSGSGCARFDR